MQKRIDATRQQNQAANDNQPGDGTLAALAAVLGVLNKTGQARQRFVHEAAVRQGPQLFDQERGKQRKKSHASGLRRTIRSRAVSEKPTIPYSSVMQ